MLPDESTGRVQTPVPAKQPVDRLMSYRRSLAEVAGWQRFSLLMGVFLVISGILGVVALSPPWLGLGVLAIGLALLIMSAIQAVNIAIRETHIDEAERK